MSRFFLFFSFAMVFASCTTRYKIDGESTLSRMDGRKLFIKVFDNQGVMTAIDSAEVIHGHFHMKGQIDSVMMVMLFMDENALMPLVLEKGIIKVRIDNMQLIAKGTNLNDKLYDFFKRKNVLEEQMDELERREARLIMDGEDPDLVQYDLRKEGENLNESMNNLLKGFITENYENVLGASLFLMYNTPYPVMSPVMDDIFKNAPESFKNNPMIKKYVSQARENAQKIKERVQ